MMKGQSQRSSKQPREPKNRPTYTLLIDFVQKYKGNLLEKRTLDSIIGHTYGKK